MESKQLTSEKKLSDFSQLVQLVHGRDEFQSQILEGKSSTYPISFLTSKSKPLLSLQHGPLGFPSCSLRQMALVGSTDHLHCQSSGRHPSSFFTTSCQHKAIGNPVWPSFPKWLLSCGKFSSCLPESFFLVSFEGSSSLAQSINAPASTLGPFLLFCLARSCPRGFHSNSSFISI